MQKYRNSFESLVQSHANNKLIQNPCLLNKFKLPTNDQNLKLQNLKLNKDSSSFRENLRIKNCKSFHIEKSQIQMPSIFSKF